MVRILKPEDVQTAEEARAEQANYTDEDVQKFGYPNLEVYRLEKRLGQELAEWIRKRDDASVERYMAVLYAMILKGFDPSGLDVHLQLPPDVMPDIPSVETIRNMQRGYALIAE